MDDTSSTDRTELERGSVQVGDMEFASADPHPDPQELDRNAERVREALRELGHKQVSA